MKVGISVLVDNLRSSLWFVPGLMTVGAASVALLTIEIDESHAWEMAGISSRLWTRP